MAVAIIMLLSSNQAKLSEIQKLKEEGSKVEYKEVTNFKDATSETYKVKKIELSFDYSRVIAIGGPITTETGIVVPDLIRRLDDGQTPIYLFLNSPGGSVMAGAQVLTAMENSKSPVYTVCTQLCASMAFVIHQYGKQRYMVNRSVIMAHLASGGTGGEIEKMHSMIAMILKYLQKIDLPIAARAGISIEQFRVLQASELWLDSDEATGRKFNDAVVVLKPDAGSSDEYALKGNPRSSSNDDSEDKKGKKSEKDDKKKDSYDFNYILDPNRMVK
jgi:ATP-dependent Clp protease protease subunit